CGEPAGAGVDGETDAPREARPLRAHSDQRPDPRPWHALAAGDLGPAPRGVSEDTGTRNLGNGRSEQSPLRKLRKTVCFASSASPPLTDQGRRRQSRAARLPGGAARARAAWTKGAQAATGTRPGTRASGRAGSQDPEPDGGARSVSMRALRQSVAVDGRA